MELRVLSWKGWNKKALNRFEVMKMEHQITRRKEKQLRRSKSADGGIKICGEYSNYVIN
jgi:hypothetical protein